ncbi:hypothetical protein DFH28DRAFT_928829 [Melampsora americana]|nr:hypothetical protein DFH28DRAFT_928829 [Melampsora americana]
MATDVRVALPMQLNGIMKIEEKVETPSVIESILQIYKTEIWFDRGTLSALKFLVAARKYDRPLQTGAYYRFEGPIIPQLGNDNTRFFPNEDNSINVGTNLIRPVCLANKVTVNSRGIITQLIHQQRDQIHESMLITMLHRHRDPTTGRMVKFYTDYIINAVMLLSIFPEIFSMGRAFEFKGNLTAYSQKKKRFIVTVTDVTMIIA